MLAPARVSRGLGDHRTPRTLKLTLAISLAMLAVLVPLAHSSPPDPRCCGPVWPQARAPFRHQALLLRHDAVAVGYQHGDRRFVPPPGPQRSTGRGWSMTDRSATFWSA